MITLVYPYYENGGILDRHLAEWQTYPDWIKENCRAIIIDDGSPMDYAENHIHAVGFPIQLYRIKQNLPWNIPGARNLGMHVAQDGWCLITDIDHLLKADDAEKLIAAITLGDPNALTYFMLARRWADGRPLKSHTNSYVLDRELYWRCGGTDEDWTGYWGAGEQVFRKMIMSIAARVDLVDVYLTHYGRDDIPDASTREWGRRDSPYDWARNPMLVAKTKLPPYRPANPLRFGWEQVL